MENQVQFQNWKYDLENVQINSQIDCLRIIELNVSNVCDLKCPFCPHGYGWKSKLAFMDMNLVDEVAKQLHLIGYKGYICVAGHGEPTLHPQIASIMKMLAEFKTILLTNGVKLSKDTIQQVKDLCQLKVSVHDWSRIEWFKEKFAGTNAIFRNHDAQNPQMNLYNRAGFLNVPATAFTTRCNYPFYKIMVDCDGKYDICEADWKDASKTPYTIREVPIDKYFVDKLNDARKMMLSENCRQNCSSCKQCDIVGTMAGNKFVDFWRSNNGI